MKLSCCGSAGPQRRWCPLRSVHQRMRQEIAAVKIAQTVSREPSRGSSPVLHVQNLYCYYCFGLTAHTSTLYVKCTSECENSLALRLPCAMPTYLKRLVVSSLQEHPRDPMRDRQELATISCTFEEVEFFGRHPDVFQALGAVLVVTPLGLIHKEFV